MDDVDATARQVETLGGTLLRAPEDIPGIGRFCVLQDPQGATPCAITYRKPRTPGRHPAVRGEVTLGPGEERAVERIPEPLRRFL